MRRMWNRSGHASTRPSSISTTGYLANYNFKCHVYWGHICRPQWGGRWMLCRLPWRPVAFATGDGYCCRNSSICTGRDPTVRTSIVVMAMQIMKGLRMIVDISNWIASARYHAYAPTLLYLCFMPAAEVLIFASESIFYCCFSISSPLLFRYALHPPSSITVPKGNRVTFFRPSVAYLFDRDDGINIASVRTRKKSPQAVRHYENNYSSD